MRRILNMKNIVQKIGYASIAVVDPLPSGSVAIETISVTEDACDLSGAWLLEPSELHKASTILSDKLIIVLGESKKLPGPLSDFSKMQVSIQDFLIQARHEVSTALKLFRDFQVNNEKEYADYMNIKPAERKLLPKVTKKNLVEPSFSKWPQDLNLSAAESELDSLGKLSKIEGTPEEMRKVLAASRLVQMLVYMWKKDETERQNRQYVKNEDSVNTILPTPWLKKLNS